MRAATQPRRGRMNTRGGLVRFWLIVLPLTLIMAACGGPPATVVVRGTNTPTPIPSALPEVATDLPAGFPGNPLRLMLIPQDLEQGEALKPQLENAILQSTSVTVELVFATDRLQLLDALCDTSSSSLTAIWADALTYSVASARRCGDAAVWLLPVLMLGANSVDVTSFEEVREYPDTTALLNAVALGECAGTGIATNTLVNWQATNPEAAENLVGVLQSVPIPYGVLMYPYQIPTSARLALTNELPNLAAVMLPTPTPDALSTEDVNLTETATPSAINTQEIVSTSGATVEAETTTSPDATLEATGEADATDEADTEATSEATDDAEAEATDIDAEDTGEPDATAEATSAATEEIEAALTAEATQDAEATGEPVLDTDTITQVEDTSTLLAPFVGPGKLVALNADDLVELDAFLASSGLNFSQLGQ